MTRFVAAGFRAGAIAGVLATACAVVFTTRVFVDADTMRLRVVTMPMAGQEGGVRVPLAPELTAKLGAVAAVIARIRHDGGASAVFSIVVDGKSVCSTTSARRVARVDCAWQRSTESSAGALRDTRLTASSEIVVRGPGTPWALEYLELATHHGGTSGLVNLLVLPRDSARAISPSFAWAVLVWAACYVVLLLPAAPPTLHDGSRWTRALLAVPGVCVIGLFAAVLVSPWVSPYRVVLSVWTFAGALAVALAPRVWAAARGQTPRAIAIERGLAWGLAVAVAAIALAAGSRAVSASDSYGYVSQAELWLHGDLTVEQSLAADAPWPDADRTFAPLGYLPQPGVAHTLVPSYPAGLPIVLAAASRLGGAAAMFWVVPLAAGVLVLAAYGLGRRLAGGGAGLAAAWLVATSPVVIAQSVVVMTDVPVAAAWTGAAFFVLGPGVRSAFVAGLCAGLAVLIRPNLVPIAAVLGGVYLRALAGTDDRRAAARQAIAFALGAAPGVIAVAAINASLYGSPLASGYGEIAGLFDPARVWTNLRLYLTWFAQMHAVLPLAGLVALVLPPRLLPWSNGGRRALPLMAASVAVLWLMYAAWLVFDDWLFTRFLLPSWPLIMTGAGAVAVAASRYRVIGGWAAVVVLAIGVANLKTNADYRTLTFGRNEDRYVAAAQLTRQHVPPNGVVFSLLHSGTVRHYSGLTTLNYRYLEGAWLDRSVAWLQAKGVKAYALLDDSELPAFRTRFAGAEALHALERPPVAQILDGEATSLFELAATRVP